jgi:hypothetical protein
MEYTIKIQDQSIYWYVTFRDEVITSISDGKQVYTQDHWFFWYAEPYVKDLILAKLGYIV